MRSRRVWAAFILGVLVLFSGAALGVLATFLLAPSSVPPSLTPPDQPTSVSVTAQAYSDPREVSVSIRKEAPTVLRVGRAGVVTSFDCPGSDQGWFSGSSSVSIDGTPILNFHTAVPLWREVTIGDEGPDVTSLKEELVRLGQQVSDSPKFNRVDLASMKEVLKAAHASADVTTVDPAQLLWLPTPQLTPTNCGALLGSPIAANERVADAGSSVELAIEEVPSDLRPGVRQLKVDQLEFSLNEDLTLAVPAEAVELLQTPSFRSAVGEATDQMQLVSLSASIVLIDPIQAAPLPPSAVTVAGPPAGCVEDSEGRQHRLTVVSSELGRSIVIFENTIPTKVNVSGPAECE